MWRPPLLLAEGAQCDGVMGGQKHNTPQKSVSQGVPLKLKATYMVAFGQEQLLFELEHRLFQRKKVFHVDAVSFSPTAAPQLSVPLGLERL